MSSTSEAIFDVFGDKTSLQILILGSADPVSVSEIADLCDIAPATVYRKANRLVEDGMLDEETAISENGDHYKRYRTTVEEIAFTFRDGELTVSLDADWNGSGGLGALWADRDDSLSTSTEFTIGLPDRSEESTD